MTYNLQTFLTIFMWNNNKTNVVKQIFVGEKKSDKNSLAGTSIRTYRESDLHLTRPSKITNVFMIEVSNLNLLNRKFNAKRVCHVQENIRNSGVFETSIDVDMANIDARLNSLQAYIADLE